MIKVTCPNCLRISSVPEEYNGRKVKCESCAESFVVDNSAKTRPVKTEIDAAKKPPKLPKPNIATNKKESKDNAGLYKRLKNAVSYKAMKTRIDDMPKKITLFLRNGWTRLWLVISIILWVSVVVGCSWYVWGIEACYRYSNCSMQLNYPENHADDDNHHKYLLNALGNQTDIVYCGDKGFPQWHADLEFDLGSHYVIVACAEDEIISAAHFEWWDGYGWSKETSGEMIIIDSAELTKNNIISRVNKEVHASRFKNIFWIIISAAATPLIVLMLGYGIVWIRKGWSLTPSQCPNR